MAGEAAKEYGPLALIADDDGTVRTIMREVLGQAGFRVEEAGDGQAALDLFERLRPDVVLLDVEMPYLDGYTVCRRIRSSPALRDTPVFIITGRDDSHSIEQAYDVGATDFISKPIAWPLLAHRVRFVLRASDALNEIKGLVKAIPDQIFVLNEQGDSCTAFSSSRQYQATIAEVASDRAFAEAFPRDLRPALKSKVREALDSGEPQILEYAAESDDTHIEMRLVARDHNTVLAIARNVTARKEFEDQIYHLAYYDRLTGLPNRQLFQQTLDKAIAGAEATGDQLTILFVDLDRFKRINDTLGHSMGDALLHSVAERLRTCTGSNDEEDGVRLARLGGDEFVLLLSGVDCRTSASEMAERIVTALSKPFQCEGHQLVVTPSIGVTMYPQDGATSESLLMNADSAMYRAKASGRNNHKFYSDTMRIRSLHRLDIETELRSAIEKGQFSLHYQPKVDAKTWSIVGAEALMRWKHPERGWISPADFIPVAEESGLIVPMGRWVLGEACRQIGLWRRSPLSGVRVSVNMSSQQMYTDDLLKLVTGSLADAGVDANLLELEITESLLMRDTDSTVHILTELKNLGVAISIDDFGTGYSSLSYLKRFPIDTLKIDKSFVQDLHIDNDDAAICAAILAMARRLDLKVVAEGVEIEEQLEFLLSHGCHQIQGYLVSRPLPADALEEFARERRGLVAMV